MGGKLPPRLAPLCRSLRRTFPANVAILSAQLRGRISGAQSAGLFDSLFQRRHPHWECCPRSETVRILIAHGSSRARWLRGTRYKRKLLDASRPPILRQFFRRKVTRCDQTIVLLVTDRHLFLCNFELKQCDHVIAHELGCDWTAHE